MKTLTLNQRAALYCLAASMFYMTQPWHLSRMGQTASASAATVNSVNPDAPSSENKAVMTREMVVNGDARVHVEIREVVDNPKRVDYEGGRFVEKNEPSTHIEASFTKDGCTDCLERLIINDRPQQFEKLLAQIETNLKTQLKKLEEKEQAEKEREKKVANCEIKILDGKEVDITESRADSYKCELQNLLSDTKKRKASREELAEAYQDFVDKVQADLAESTSNKERKDILAAVKGLKGISNDAKLRLPYTFLERGAQDLINTIKYAEASAQNPLTRYNNTLMLNRIGCSYNLQRNIHQPMISDASCYGTTDPSVYKSEIASQAMADWSEFIMNPVTVAMKDPEQIVRDFFSGANPPGDKSLGGSSARAQRTYMQLFPQAQLNNGLGTGAPLSGGGSAGRGGCIPGVVTRTCNGSDGGTAQIYDPLLNPSAQFSLNGGAPSAGGIPQMGSTGRW